MEMDKGETARGTGDERRKSEMKGERGDKEKKE